MSGATRGHPCTSTPSSRILSCSRFSNPTEETKQLRSFTLAAAAAALTPALLAQTDWTQLSPTTFPTARAGTVGVTDGAVAYLFGGQPDSTSEYNDLWLFDGTNWTDITPATGPLPPARDFYAAAYDIARSRYVLFGGRSTALATDLADTWEFDGTSWTQLTPATSPSIRR